MHRHFHFLFHFRVIIESPGDGHKHTFCAEDLPFFNGKPRNVIWKPNCRNNVQESQATLLGTLLNADPVGNTKFVIDQVNPLATNPLNGLGVISDTFNELMNAPQTVSKVIKRIDSKMKN